MERGSTPPELADVPDDVQVQTSHGTGSVDRQQEKLYLQEVVINRPTATPLRKPHKKKSKDCQDSLLETQPPLRASWLAKTVPGFSWTTRCTGWRMGVSLCTLVTALVLIINLTCTIWVVGTFRSRSGTRVVQEGSCKSVRSSSIWIHLAINVSSTILLGASNYTMQCLVSPTRSEIDSAHCKDRSLKIGILSTNNLEYIGSKKVGLWILLAFSSIPLHTLFNSVVFEVASTNDYSIAVVSETFMQGAPVDQERLHPLDFTGTKTITTTQLVNVTVPITTTRKITIWVNATESTPTRWPFATLQRDITQLEHLSVEACVNAYQNPIISERRNLLAVTNDAKPTDDKSILSFTFSTIDGSWDTHGGSTAWICAYLPKYWDTASPPSCRGGDVIAKLASSNTSVWNIMGQPIQYCLSETVKDQHCQLAFSVVFMAVVLVCNFLKTAAMLLSLFHIGEDPVVTIGDAAASFLRDEDTTTLGDRLVSKDYLPHSCWSGDTLKIIEFRDDTPRWCQAPSPWLWCWCISLWLIALITASVLLPIATKQLSINGIATNLRSLWNLGFGAVHDSNLVKLGRANPYQNSVTTVLLLSNLPQLLLSGMYMAYNNLYTCMISNDEWLPYKFSLPLLCASALLHWLVSQSIFLARIRIFDMFGQEKTHASITTVGYSCIALILAMVIGNSMLICCIAVGLRRYPLATPVIRNSSLKISAACHPPKEELDISYNAVQWGVITKSVPVRYCTLSTATVQAASYTRCFVLHGDVDRMVASIGEEGCVGPDAAVLVPGPLIAPKNEEPITRSDAFLVRNYGSRNYRPRRYIPR